MRCSISGRTAEQRGRPVLPCPLSGSGPAVTGPVPGTPGRAVTGISGTPRGRRCAVAVTRELPPPAPAAARSGRGAVPVLRVHAGVGHPRPPEGAHTRAGEHGEEFRTPPCAYSPARVRADRGIPGAAVRSAPAGIHPCGKRDGPVRSAGRYRCAGRRPSRSPGGARRGACPGATSRAGAARSRWSGAPAGVPERGPVGVGRGCPALRGLRG